MREPWLDMRGPVRSLLVAIFSWVAEQERFRLVERTHAGIERARRQGKRIGRPPAAINVTAARALRKDGASVRAIARQLGVSKTSLHRVGVLAASVQKITVRVGGPSSSALTQCVHGLDARLGRLQQATDSRRVNAKEARGVRRALATGEHHLPHLDSLVRLQLRSAPTDAPLCARSLEPGARPLARHRALELGEAAEDLHHHAGRLGSWCRPPR